MPLAFGLHSDARDENIDGIKIRAIEARTQLWLVNALKMDIVLPRLHPLTFVFIVPTHPPYPLMKIALPPGYKPKQSEPFMNAQQREYFRLKLIEWRDLLLQEGNNTKRELQRGTQKESDPLDQALSESERSITLRTRDRERKLIVKIEQALQRIENGTYGYCEFSGEPISIKRLEARPIATMSIEAQELHESTEKTRATPR